MKTIPFLALFIIGITFANAQDVYTHSLDGITKVDIVSAKVKLEVGTTNELIVKYQTLYGDRDNIGNKRSKGLKAIYSGGIDNTGIGLSIEKDGEVLKVTDLKYMRGSRLVILLPKDMDVKLDCGNLGSADIEGFSSEIEVKSNVGHILIKNVSGPITAFSNTGLIEVIFEKVNQSSPISIRTNTGTVDVSLPTNTKTDLELKTNFGTVYTDFDFVVENKKGMRTVGGNRSIKTKLNSGGVKITLSSHMGNVYLRKRG